MENKMLLSEAQKGDVASIFELLKHKGAIYRVNGIINSARHKITNTDIISMINELIADNTFLDGYSVSDFAYAALDMLGAATYKGSSQSVKRLINSRFEF